MSILYCKKYKKKKTKQNKTTMIGQMAIARALSEVNDLGRSVTPIFLLMNHCIYRFSTFSEKMKKSYWLEV